MSDNDSNYQNRAIPATGILTQEVKFNCVEPIDASAYKSMSSWNNCVRNDATKRESYIYLMKTKDLTLKVGRAIDPKTRKREHERETGKEIVEMDFFKVNHEVAPRLEGLIHRQIREKIKPKNRRIEWYEFSIAVLNEYEFSKKEFSCD